MNYQKIVSTLSCASLFVIAWQLHQMRPLRYSDIEQLGKSNPKEALQKLQNAPIVAIGRAHTRISVDADLPHLPGVFDVNVINSIDAQVTTGGETLGDKFYERPLRVEIVR